MGSAVHMANSPLPLIPSVQTHNVGCKTLIGWGPESGTPTYQMS